MKSRPILFSAPMVRALLAGTKAQTRRVIKDQSIGDRASHSLGDGRIHLEWLGTPNCGSGVWDVPEYSAQVASPYGLIGDQLWVRESWMPDPPCDGTWAYTAWAGERIGQIAGVPERFRHPKFCNYAAEWIDDKVLWTPSIHMPRWASRITLEITGVRVERLGDISETDAQAEGSLSWAGEQDTPVRDLLEARLVYRQLWEEINGPGSWDLNPWVWVIEFRRLP